MKQVTHALLTCTLHDKYRIKYGEPTFVD